LAFDAAGNLYVVNWGSSTVSKVTPAGVVSTFVASGLNNPNGSAIDSLGNLYVGNYNGWSVSKVTPSGAVSTFAGSLVYPMGLAFDAAGDLYVVDSSSDTVSKVTSAGAVSRLAITGLDWPQGLAFDAAGNFYVANSGNNTISKVAPSGAVSTFVSSGLNSPVGLAFDAGDLYVANSGNNTISKIAPPVLGAFRLFSGTVFRFIDSDPQAAPSDYTAVVTLGDGNSVTLSSSGVVSGPVGAGGQIVADPNGGFDVQLSYTYAEALSNQTFAVKVTDLNGASISASESNFNVTSITTATRLTASRPSVAYGTAVTFTATVAAETGSTAPRTGSFDFYDATSGHDLGLGSFSGSSGTTSTWTLTTGAKTFNVTAGDTITATYTPGVGFAGSSGTTTEVVTPALLKVAGITAIDKVYNGNPVATLDTSGAALVGVFSGDVVTLGTSGASGTFASKNVATNATVTVSGLSTVSGITAADKTYNANTTATLVGLGSASLATVYSGDTVTLNTTAAMGTFASKDVGQNITVSVSGLTLGGTQANDYTLTQPTTIANITARPITVTATSSTKTYDGTTASTAIPTITGGSIAAGDAASFTETFSNKHAGVGKILIPTGSIDDGESGADYAVTFANAAVGRICPRPITVTAAANTKGYDGTTAASALPTITSGSLVAGDTASWSESYDSAAVGTGETLMPAGIVDDDNGGGNYQVTFAPNTGVITQTMDHFVVAASPASVTAGESFLLAVTAEDAAGNVVSGYAGTVQFISSDPLEPQPAAALSFTPGLGVAYTLATLQTVGSWTITAGDGYYSGTTAPVTVSAACVSTVAFSQQPAGTSVGATIPLTVKVEDAYGNVVSSGAGSTANVTLAIASGPAGGQLWGTTTVKAVGGVATFSNLSIDQAGNYTLTASAAGVGGTVTSSSFNVTAGPASQLAFTGQPTNTPGADTMANVKVAVEDQYGNPVTTDSSNVTLTLNAATSGGGGVLKGTTTVAAVGGVATFSGLSIVNSSNNSYSAAGTGYSLTVNDTDNGVALTVAKSAVFNTTLIVTSCTMTPTGFVATFSQPFEVATTPRLIGPNLYGAAASGEVPANVSLIGSNEGTVRGSLVLNSTDTQITFLATTLVKNSGLPIAGVSSPDATSGILAPDGYLVTLTSGSTSFVTANGQLLDGNDSGVGGANFQQFTAVNDSADVQVVIPSFARGPSSGTITSVVNLPNAAAPIVSGLLGLSESGGTVTVTTTAPDGLAVGDPVTIFGAGLGGYDGTFTVTSLPGGAYGTTFTYTDPVTGLAPSGGGTASLASGIPLSLFGPSGGVTSGQFTLTYNASDLSISSALVNPTLAASYGATLSLDSSSAPGNAIIDFSTAMPLPTAGSTPILLGGLTATVPSAAYYGSKDLLHFSSVALQSGGHSVAAIGSDALHLVVFPGDTTGEDGFVSSADQLNISRVVAGADAGFAAYPVVDPDLLGDLMGDGEVDGPAGAMLGRYVNGITSPQMPAYPGRPLNMLSVAGPSVSIPSASQLGVGSSVMASMTVADTALPVLPALTASVGTAPVTSANALSTVAAVGVSPHVSTPVVAARVSQHVADDLFAAVGRGVVALDELAILANGEQATSPVLAAQMSAGGSAQANLDSLLWESGDSSWLDSKRDWLS
jgi:hypothetical protein